MPRGERIRGFSRREFLGRTAKVRELMVQKGLAALIIFDNDRMAGGGSVRYLSNFFSTDPFSPAAVVLLPGEEPTLCIAPGFQGCQFTWARERSFIRKVKGTSSGGWNVDWVKDITEALFEANLSGGKVGIDGINLMPLRMLERLKGELSGSGVEDVTGLVERVRLIKSRAETGLLRRAAELSRAGFAAFVRAAKPGVLQARAIAQAELAVRKSGAEEAMMFMGTGVPWIWGSRRGDLTFESGAMVAAEFNARYQGYLGQICRTFFLGKPTRKQRAVHDAVVTAYDRMTASVRPGVTAAELFEIGMAVLSRAGFEYSGVRFGHGLGLNLAEGFSIEPGDRTPIGAGTCLVVHPNVALPPSGLSAIHGDTLLVGEDGVEVLTCEKRSRPSKRGAPRRTR